MSAIEECYNLKEAYYKEGDGHPDPHFYNEKLRNVEIGHQLILKPWTPNGLNIAWINLVW